MICAACTLVLANTGTTLLADSSNFAGPYIGVSGLAAGVSADGKARSTTTTDTAGSTDTLNVGKATLAQGIEVGYALPLGSMFLLDIGGSYLSGEAKNRARRR